MVVSLCFSALVSTFALSSFLRENTCFLNGTCTYFNDVPDSGGFILLDLARPVFFISVKLLAIIRVKSGDFGHQVNSDSNLDCFIF